MRINEILVESQQLDEGPFGQAVGKAVGGLAKGVGAVAGGIAGIPGAVKKGFKAGKATVSGDPAADATQTAPAAPAAATSAPAAATPAPAAATSAPAAKAAGGGIIDKIKQGFAQGQGTAAAPDATTEPAASPAAAAAAEKEAKIGVGQINKIIPTLRTRDLISLQTNLEKAIASKKKAAPAAPAAPAAEPAAAAPAAPATTPPAADAATAAAPAAPGTDAAKDELYGAGNRPKGAKDKVAALKSQNKKKAPPQAEIDAERERLMGVTSDSIIRKGRVMAESFSLYRKH